MTHVTRINTGAFERLASFLEKYPEKHDQSMWFDGDNLCDSTGCIAGWVCIHETDHFKVYDGAYAPTPEAYADWMGYDKAVSMDPEQRMNSLVTQYHSYKMAYFFETAKDVLGLDFAQAEHLFDGDHGPLNGLTVSEALHKIAMGAEIDEVWGDNDE